MVRIFSFRRNFKSLKYFPPSKKQISTDRQIDRKIDHIVSDLPAYFFFKIGDKFRTVRPKRSSEFFFLTAPSLGIRTTREISNSFKFRSVEEESNRVSNFSYSIRVIPHTSIPQASVRNLYNILKGSCGKKGSGVLSIL
ncbi:hypothetical protein TWF102_005686 [Orbilia oligospora]|uniref:Uncharacterized protein n=1 Tax=Orbilia oligospora TaxID=2813651 RepID=A0A7C8JFZ6_ORBOL|nr:hypothetical protein TWF102_005686 [Orbilia oligospora]KAF3114610.1 hypothetical protein TWF103_001070 [Orbilia oligospora]KAF3146469.1 hypothetical protein TWF594_003262 [Orbilia oligospora]